jgi:hypothetical protein
VLLVLASYVFYAYAKWWFALLMAASTLVGYAGGRALERTRRKLVLAATVASLSRCSALSSTPRSSAATSRASSA